MDTTYGDFPIEEIEGYHFEENTDGKIKNAATRVLRDCRIFGNCGKNLINLDAGIDSNGVLTKNNDGTYKQTKLSTNRFAKIIPVSISANTHFVISYELIEYTGAESYQPIQLILKFSDRANSTISPYNTDSTNKRIYSTSRMYKNDITAIQLYCEGNSAQPVGSYTVFKNFQIELGDESYSEEIDYESYAEVGDSDTESGKYILSVTASGKNLIPYPYLMTTMTVNGITFTDNGDGTVIADGTATADATFRMSYFTVKKGVTYYLSGCPKGGSKSTFYFWLRGYDVDIGNGLKIAPTYDFTNNFEIVIKQGAVVNNLIFKPQFEIGITATDFEPYTAPKTTNLLLDAPLGPGESISCREKGLLVPELATTDPQITNYISFGSKIKPSSAKFEYYKY